MTNFCTLPDSTQDYIQTIEYLYLHLTSSSTVKKIQNDLLQKVLKYFLVPAFILAPNVSKVYDIIKVSPQPG